MSFISAGTKESFSQGCLPGFRWREADGSNEDSEAGISRGWGKMAIVRRFWNPHLSATAAISTFSERRGGYKQNNDCGRHSGVIFGHFGGPSREQSFEYFCADVEKRLRFAAKNWPAIGFLPWGPGCAWENVRVRAAATCRR